MYKIIFLNNFLKQRKNQKLKINLSGIITMEYEVFKFNYKIVNHKLKILDRNKLVIVIDFCEVNMIKKLDKNGLELILNFKENIRIS